MTQAKFQDRTPERGLNETEITNLLHKDLKMKVINMLTDLPKKYSRSQGGLLQRVEGLKEGHSELKTTVSEVKHTMEGFKSRSEHVEEMEYEIEIREQENKEPEEQREKRISRNERMIRAI